MSNDEGKSLETGGPIIADGIVDEPWQGKTLEQEVEDGELSKETYKKLYNFQNQQGIMKITPVQQMQTYVRSTVAYIAEGVEYAQIQMFPICDVNVTPHQISFDFFDTTEGKIGISNATEKHMVVECDVYVTDLLYFYWNHGNVDGSDYKSINVRNKQVQALRQMIDRVLDYSKLEEEIDELEKKEKTKANEVLINALKLKKDAKEKQIIEDGKKAETKLPDGLDDDFVDDGKSHVFEVKFDDDWRKVNYKTYLKYKEQGYPTRIDGGVGAETYDVYPTDFEIQNDNGEWEKVTYEEFWNQTNNGKTGRIDGGNNDKLHPTYWGYQHTFQLQNKNGKWINVPYESYIHAVRDGKPHQIDNGAAVIEDPEGQFNYMGNTYDKQKAKEDKDAADKLKKDKEKAKKTNDAPTKEDFSKYFNNFEDTQEFIEFRQHFLQQHSGWMCTFTSNVFGTFLGVLTEVRYEVPSGETGAKFHLKIEEAIFTADYSPNGMKRDYTTSETQSDVSQDGSTTNSGTV